MNFWDILTLSNKYYDTTSSITYNNYKPEYFKEYTTILRRALGIFAMAPSAFSVMFTPANSPNRTDNNIVYYQGEKFSYTHILYKLSLFFSKMPLFEQKSYYKVAYLKDTDTEYTGIITTMNENTLNGYYILSAQFFPTENKMVVSYKRVEAPKNIFAKFFGSFIDLGADILRRSEDLIRTGGAGFMEYSIPPITNQEYK